MTAIYFVFGRCALFSCVAASILTACGGSQPAIRATGAMPQIETPATEMVHRLLQLGPASTSGDLIYAVPAARKSAFFILTYPDGELVKKVKTSSQPWGLCSDEPGNVYVLFGAIIYVYAHGATKPSRTLTDPGTGTSCAVDPTTGNLAVSNRGYLYGESGSTAIYAGARGTPTVYVDPEVFFPNECAYDGVGNLFETGFGEGFEPPPLLAELPAGSGTFTNITLSEPFGLTVHWDGQYITIGASYRHNTLIDRVQISGSVINIIGKTRLNRPGSSRGEDGDYWIQGATVINTGWRSGLWNYPKGGRQIERYLPSRLGGVTVSVAPSR